MQFTMGFQQLLLSVLSILCYLRVSNCTTDTDEATDNARYKVEGKVVVPFTLDQEWVTETRVMLDGGQYMGLLRHDGSFVVNNVPSGSYIVEVFNSAYIFEPARVDINSKGKIRARRLNYIQPSDVKTMTYPLKFKARAKANYFQQREQWRITDFLFSPMVMMMIVPFLMIMVLPKLINTQDPETQREMQNSMNFLNPNKSNMPELSEMVTNFFGGGSSKKSSKPKAIKKRT